MSLHLWASIYQMLPTNSRKLRKTNILRLCTKTYDNYINEYKTLTFIDRAYIFFPCHYISFICKDKIILSEWAIQFQNMHEATIKLHIELNSQNCCFQISCCSIWVEMKYTDKFLLKICKEQPLKFDCTCNNYVSA